MIKWIGKMWRIGGSWVVTIPGDFIKHEGISEDKEYKITMKEV